MDSVITIKVRGYHVDVNRHVNNARYLEFLEEGRWAFFDDNPGFNGWPEEADFSVVNINIDYRKGAGVGDVLEVRTNISRLGQKSGTVHQAIALQGTQSVVAEADVTFVMADRRTQKALPLEGRLLDFLRGLMNAEEPPSIRAK